MTHLSGISIILGSVLAMLHVPCVFLPQQTRGWVSRFPRNTWAGWILAAGALAWSAWLLHETPLGRFEHLKSLLYIVAPVAYVAVILSMTELLAARALGGLLLLVPAPILDAARWEPSLFRLVIVVLAYALVIAGVILVLSPYQFRKAMNVCLKNNTRCRTVGAAGVAVGLLVVVLGLLVF